MKYKITVNNKSYEVKIEDINTRPVIAFVDGDRFEVMPENADQAETKKEAGRKTESKTFNPNPAPAAVPSPNLALSGNTQTAPLPGTVIEVFVKAGDKVEAGQVILVIEAMKMSSGNNSVLMPASYNTPIMPSAAVMPASGIFASKHPKPIGNNSTGSISLNTAR